MPLATAVPSSDTMFLNTSPAPPPASPTKLNVTVSPVILVAISVPPASVKTSAVPSAVVLPVSACIVVNLLSPVPLGTTFHAVPSHCHIVPPDSNVSPTSGLAG